MKLWDKGFTLLELMVAAAILVIVVVGLLLTFVYSILLNESNNNLVAAVNDAQYALEQIKGKTYNEIPNYIPPDFNNLQDEDVDFTYSVNGNITEVTVDVSWKERQRDRSFSLSTRIAR